MNNEILVGVMDSVVKALIERGYNPYAQIKGYLSEGNPIYITSHNNARNMLQTLDKSEIKDYMHHWERYQDEKWRIEFVKSHF